MFQTICPTFGLSLGTSTGKCCLEEIAALLPHLGVLSIQKVDVKNHGLRSLPPRWWHHQTFIVGQEKRLRRTSRPKQSGLQERSDYNVLTLGGTSSDAEFQSPISEPHFRRIIRRRISILTTSGYGMFPSARSSSAAGATPPLLVAPSVTVSKRESYK